MLLSLETMIILGGLVVVFVGACFFQAWMVKRTGWRPAGWVLPLLSFASSVSVLIPNLYKVFEYSFSAGAFMATAIFFLFMNVPTAVFIMIGVRGKYKIAHLKELEKMSVQDL